MPTPKIPNPQSEIPNSHPLTLPLGHEAIAEHFRRSIAHGRLASTFLFVGNPGIGKRTFAIWLAQALLCPQTADERLEPCGSCPDCLQVAAHSHPDVEMVQKPPDKAFIPVELFIGDREHRMREGLCHNISLKPYAGRRKVAIIDDADHLNQESANCLLKTLEEPPPASMIILVGTSEQRQLPTIRSRCQIVRFATLSQGDVARVIQQTGVTDDPEEAERMAASSGGSIRGALELKDPDIQGFRQQLVQQIAESPDHLLGYAADVNAFVDQAGKESSVRRDRLRRVVRIAAHFYRALMHGLSGLPPHGDPALVSGVNQCQQNWPGDAETAAACLERCLDAEAHVDSNAAPAIVVDCWLDDLSTIARSA